MGKVYLGNLTLTDCENENYKELIKERKEIEENPLLEYTSMELEIELRRRYDSIKANLCQDFVHKSNYNLLKDLRYEVERDNLLNL